MGVIPKKYLASMVTIFRKLSKQQKNLPEKLKTCPDLANSL
jgi:hypothetical protein